MTHSIPSSYLTIRDAVARSCNLLFIVLDVLKPLDDKRVIENELEGFGIRLNKVPPHITVKKKDKGGIAITNTVPLTHLEHEEIKAVCAEYRMANCDIAFRSDATLDELIDVLEGNRCVSLTWPRTLSLMWLNDDSVYMPCIYALNKVRLNDEVIIKLMLTSIPLAR